MTVSYYQLRKAFANNSTANIKLSRTKLSKIVKLGRFPDSLLGSLLKTGLFSIKHLLQPLIKSILIPLTATAADAGILKKFSDQGYVQVC